MVSGERYLCRHNCKRLLTKKEMPPQCSQNGLEFSIIPECLQLEDLESQLIAKSLVFMKIRQLPKSPKSKDSRDFCATQAE